MKTMNNYKEFLEYRKKQQRREPYENMDKDDLIDKIVELEDIVDKSQESYTDEFNFRKELSYRIDKAIEYINHCDEYAKKLESKYNYIISSKLLNILKGENNEDD